MDRIQKQIAELAKQTGYSTASLLTDGEILVNLKNRYPAYSKSFLLSEIALFRSQKERERCSQHIRQRFEDLR